MERMKKGKFMRTQNSILRTTSVEVMLCGMCTRIGVSLQRKNKLTLKK